jgi:hypothetical protein
MSNSSGVVLSSPAASDIDPLKGLGTIVMKRLYQRA